jgi:glutathione S-transferase
VRLATSILDLDKNIVVQETDLNDEADTIRKQNPLGKIPALVLDDGTTYYDSRVILEYFDYLAGGGRIIPHEPKARFESLRLQALCDGLLDASILIVYETRYRVPEMRVQAWIDRQMGKITRGLALLEAAPPTLDSTPNVGQIALACVLGYLDLRFEGKWRHKFPRLLDWHDVFDARVPAFASTKPAG